MQTVTFDSPAPSASGKFYGRRPQDSATTVVPSLPGNVRERITDTSFGATFSGSHNEVRSTLSRVMSLWSLATSNAENAKIFCDALNFVGAMPLGILLPRVWSDDAEVVFEWISGDRHAVVSCEGDGVIGYTYRTAGKFVPGQQIAACSNSFPADLATYLA